MPALDTVVTDFLTRLKDDLKPHSDAGVAVDVAPSGGGYLRAQDLASALELLQDALDTGDLTSVAGGGTTSVADGAGTFVPGAHVGDILTFDAATTTVGLRGLSRVIAANSDRLISLSGPVLPASVGAGETYTITSQIAQRAIDGLREGKGLADSPSGSIYGSMRTAVDGLIRLVEKLGIIQSTATLTLTGNTLDTLTVNVGGKVYTFQASLTDVDGNVDVGATASDSLDNLIAAINLGAGAGTAYAASTTLNPTVSAAAGASDTMVVTAKTAVGPAGNTIPVGDGTLGSEGTWGATTLSGGTITQLRSRSVSRPGLQTGAGSTSTVVVSADTSMKIDQFKGMTLTVSGESRRIVSNDESTFTVAPALSSPPSSSVAFSVALELRVGSVYPGRFHLAHPGGHPDSAYVADLLGQAQAAVVSWVVPT